MLKTFPKGGVHPGENKFSAGKPIESIELPKQVYIPVAQHLGAPSEPVVAKGDVVKTGQLIAKSTGFVSANIHSSVSGKVLKIDKVLDTTGYKQTCIVIDVEGDEWIETIDRSAEIKNNIDFSAEEIRSKVAENGIVGLGGATFPTHVKLSIPAGKTCKYLIINAVECEPYLTSDHQLMMEKGEEILIGCKLIQKAIGAEKVIVGIENNKPDAIKHMTELSKKFENIEVNALKVKYPQGGEKQLIKSVTKREVPSGGLPIDVGCVVQNVGTAFAIYEAVIKNKPLFERVVTVTGKSVKNPSNLRARIGTPINMLIEAAGGLPEDTGKIVNGGPMMGKAVSTDKVPVTKGTSGVLIFPESLAERVENYNCIRCGRCVTVCPMGLEPYLIKNMSAVKMYEELKAERALDCMECGSCVYVCPAGVPLLDYIRLGKANLNKILRAKKS
ncbi:MAG: electron transport complex subunit RsxC [Bacteroidales bacterium]|nr:electron transport complex subunit RsxC [Bacteroidales bacterium]MDD3860430.1 electron transport complex subunit RsxC [Bacteroidales bacterium]